MLRFWAPNLRSRVPSLRTDGLACPEKKPFYLTARRQAQGSPSQQGAAPNCPERHGSSGGKGGASSSTSITRA